MNRLGMADINDERVAVEIIDFLEDQEIAEEKGIGSDGWNRTTDFGVMNPTL